MSPKIRASLNVYFICYFTTYIHFSFFLRYFFWFVLKCRQFYQSLLSVQKYYGYFSLTALKIPSNSLFSEREWHFTDRGKMIWMTVDFSSDILEARRKWHNIFQVLENKNCQLTIQQNLSSADLPENNVL